MIKNFCLYKKQINFIKEFFDNFFIKINYLKLEEN